MIEFHPRILNQNQIGTISHQQNEIQLQKSIQFWFNERKVGWWFLRYEFLAMLKSRIRAAWISGCVDEESVLLGTYRYTYMGGEKDRRV